MCAPGLGVQLREHQHGLVERRQDLRRRDLLARPPAAGLPARPPAAGLPARPPAAGPQARLSGGAAGAGGDASVDSPADAPMDVALEASAPVVGAAGSVWCGASAAKCSLSNGGKCCYANNGDAGAKYVCQSASATCATTVLKCDSTSDCVKGEVCCLFSSFVSSAPPVASCKPAAECKPTTIGDASLPTVLATQLCDPSKVSPTECVYPSGSSCKPSTSAHLPGTYFTCK